MWLGVNKTLHFPGALLPVLKDTNHLITGLSPRSPVFDDCARQIEDGPLNLVRVGSGRSLGYVEAVWKGD